MNQTLTCGTYLGELHGWTKSRFASTSKMLVVFEDAVVIVPKSKLEAIRQGGAGQPEALLVALAIDAVLTMLRALGQRKNQRIILEAKRVSASEFAAMHPKSVLIAEEAITRMRLSRRGKGKKSSGFVLTVNHASGETVFFIPPTLNPALRSSSQIGALFASVFGARFINEVTEVKEPAPVAYKPGTDRLVAFAAGVALTIAALTCFMPWAKARLVPVGATDASAIPSFTATGTGMDLGGKRVLVLALVAAALFVVWRLQKPRRDWLLAASLAAIAVVAVGAWGDLTQMKTFARQASDSTFQVSVSPAVGLYLACLAATTAAATETILLYRRKRVGQSQGSRTCEVAC